MRAPVLIAAFVLCRVAMPVAMQAEQAKGVPQIGYLPPVQRADYDPTKDPLKAAFLDGLREFGYVEGKNIHVEFRAPRKPEDIAEMAADLVNRKVDVIATLGPQPIDAARHAARRRGQTCRCKRQGTQGVGERCGCLAAQRCAADQSEHVLKRMRVNLCAYHN